MSGAIPAVARRCCPGGISRSTRVPWYPPDMSDAEWAVIEPGKEVRSMPAKALTVVPQKPERLGGERDHRRVEVEQHHMLAFEL